MMYYKQYLASCRRAHPTKGVQSPEPGRSSQSRDARMPRVVRPHRSPLGSHRVRPRERSRARFSSPGRSFHGPPSLLQSSYCPPPSPSCLSSIDCVHPVQHMAYTQSMHKLGTGHWVRSMIPSRRRTAIRDAQVSTKVSTAPPAETCARNAAVSFDRACVGTLPASTHSQSTTARRKQRFAGLRQPLRRANICAVVVGMQQITAAIVRRSSMQSKRPEDHCGSADCP